jgi:hypothetical protein
VPEFVVALLALVNNVIKKSDVIKLDEGIVEGRIL